MDSFVNKDEYTNVLVDELGLHVRYSRILHKSGIHTLHQLIQKCNAGELNTVRNLGESSCAEIESKIHEYQMRVHSTSSSNDRVKEDFDVTEDFYRKDISELRLNTNQIRCLRYADINTIGDLLRTKLYDLLDLNKGQIGTIEGLKEVWMGLKERGNAYLEDIKPENEPLDELKLRTFDPDTARKLRDEFGFNVALLSEWYNVSHGRAYQMINNKTKGNWLNRKFGKSEETLTNIMLDELRYYAESENQKAYLFNNKKDDCALVFVSDTEIKCFYLYMIPDYIREKIIKKRFCCLTEEELNESLNGKKGVLLRQTFFIPADRDRFRRLATARKMSSAQYCQFLTGLPLAMNQMPLTDTKVLDFLQSHYVNGKLVIPSNNSTRWFWSFISRHGYSIEEIAELYGFKM